MDVRQALKGQYHAALAMLKQCIERCPDDLWTAGDRPRSFWRTAYHALFFTHLYLQPSEADFVPWELHRDGYQDIWPDEWPDDKRPVPYSKDELLQYWSQCDGMVDPVVDKLDLDSPTTGFHWYDMPKLDHQIMNIRHIQGHVGQLSELLMAAGVDTDWVGGRRTGR